MNTTILQIPLSKQLRDSASNAAIAEGFSSLQEAVRVFLTKLSIKTISVNFQPTTDVILSKKNDRRYDRIIRNVLSGKTKTRSFTDVDEMMDYLNN